MNKSARPYRVKGLAEVSSRAKDLDAMHKFCEEVVGLELLRRDECFVFFKITEGYGDHTQNLALFEASNTIFIDNKAVQLNPQEMMLHHVALNVALEHFESEKRRLDESGISCQSFLNQGEMYSFII